MQFIAYITHLSSSPQSSLVDLLCPRYHNIPFCCSTIIEHDISHLVNYSTGHYTVPICRIKWIFIRQTESSGYSALIVLTGHIPVQLPICLTRCLHCTFVYFELNNIIQPLASLVDNNNQFSVSLYFVPDSNSSVECQVDVLLFLY